MKTSISMRHTKLLTVIMLSAAMDLANHSTDMVFLFSEA